MDSWILVFLGVIGAALVWYGPRRLGKIWGGIMARRTLSNQATDGGASPPHPKNRGSLVALKFDAGGFRILERIPPTGRALSIPWSDVTSVAVYKEDLVVVDTMVLMFQLANGAELEFCEETEGWSDLAQDLHQHLPGCIPFHEWFMAVAFPAFQINFTVIFKREAASQVEPTR